MYIRRKVFSILEDEMGEERYFSTTDFVYDGDVYDYVDDRYFSDDEEESSHVGRDAAIAGGAAVGAAGLGYGTIKGGQAISGKRVKSLEALKNKLEKKSYKTEAREAERLAQLEKVNKRLERAQKTNAAFGGAAGEIETTVKNAPKNIKNGAIKAWDKTKEGAKKAAEKTKSGVKKAAEKTKNGAKTAAQKTKSGAQSAWAGAKKGAQATGRFAKNHKTALGLTAAGLAAGGATYGALRYANRDRD